MTRGLIITPHAVSRYQERVRRVSDDDAIRALSTPFISAAAEFGATYVRLGSGHRVVLDRMMVVTVLPAGSTLNKTGRTYHGQGG